MQPLEPRPLHPARRARRGAGDEIESGTERRRDGGSQAASALVNPQFLFWGAQGDEQQMRAGVLDPGDERVVRGASFKRHPPILDADDSSTEARKAGSGLFCGPRKTPEKE